MKRHAKRLRSSQLHPWFNLRCARRLKGDSSARRRSSCSFASFSLSSHRFLGACVQQPPLPQLRPPSRAFPCAGSSPAHPVRALGAPRVVLLQHVPAPLLLGQVARHAHATRHATRASTSGAARCTRSGSHHCRRRRLRQRHQVAPAFQQRRRSFSAPGKPCSRHPPLRRSTLC